MEVNNGITIGYVTTGTTVSILTGMEGRDQEVSKWDLMEAEMRMEEMDIRLEKGGDDYLDYDEPDYCPECGVAMVLMTDKNYGADRDGRRGIDISWQECPECGYTP